MMEHAPDITEKVGEGKGIRGIGEQFWNRSRCPEEYKASGTSPSKLASCG